MPRRYDSSDENDRGGEVQRATSSRHNERERRHKSSRRSSKRSRDRRSRSSSSEDSARGRDRHSRKRASSDRSPSTSDMDRENRRESRRRRDERHSSSSEDDRRVHRKSDRRPSNVSNKRRGHASSPVNRHRHKKHHSRRDSSSSSSSSESDDRDYRRNTARSSAKSRKRSRRSSSSPERRNRRTKRHTRRHSSSSSSSVSESERRNRSRRSKSPSPGSSSRNMPGTSDDPIQLSNSSDDDYHDGHGENQRQPENPTQSDSEIEVLSDYSEPNEDPEEWPPFASFFKDSFKKYPVLKLIHPRDYRKAAETMRKWTEDLDSNKFVNDRMKRLTNEQQEDIQALKAEGKNCEEKLRFGFTQCRTADLDLVWKEQNALLSNVSVSDFEYLGSLLEQMADEMEKDYMNKSVFEAQQHLDLPDRTVSCSPFIVFHQNTDRRAKMSDQAYSRRLQKKIDEKTEALKTQVAEVAVKFPFLHGLNETEMEEWGNRFFDAVATKEPSNEHTLLILEKLLATNDLRAIMTADDFDFREYVKEVMEKCNKNKENDLKELYETFGFPNNKHVHYLKVIDALVTVQSVKLEIRYLESVRRELTIKLRLLAREDMFFEKHTIPKEYRKYIIMSQTEWEKEGFYVFLNEVREECLVLDILTRDEETLREIHKAMDSILMNEISKEPAFHIFEEVVMTHHMSQDDAAYWSRVPESGIDQWKIDNGIDCAHLILPSSSNPPAPWILKGKLSEIKKMKQCLDSLSERNENTCREDRISQTTTIINVPYHFGEELKTIHGNALEQIESSTGTSIVLLGPKNDNYDEFGVEFKGGFEKVELAIEKVETLGPEAERVDYLQIPEYYIGDVKEKLRSWKRDFRDVSFSIDELVVEGSFTLILRGPAGKTNIAAMKVREIGTTNNMNRRNEIFHSPKNHSRLNPDYFQKRQEEIEERMKRYAEEKEMKEREEKRIWKEKRRAVNIRN